MNTKRPKLFDLFAGGGLAAWGYWRAGFDLVGVDIVMQHEYPFELILGDALTARIPDDVVAIHASPPCKAITAARTFAGGPPPSLFAAHLDLIEPCREMLKATGLPYVIENVPGAPLLDPVVLCGSMFGLGVRRHRLFESNWELSAPPCDHAGQGAVVGVYGNGGAWDSTNRPGGGGVKVVGKDAAEAMGVTHTSTQRILAQGIPPAYTEHIGRQLLDHLDQARTAA